MADDLFIDDMTPEQIKRSWTGHYDSEPLKQVGIYPDSFDYQRVSHIFSVSFQQGYFCQLVTWKDDEWVLYYSRSSHWEFKQGLWPGLLEEGYRASKERDCHYFDLSDGRPIDSIRRAA